MRWFEGSIAEAVASSKAKNAVFVVFVEGTDDVSTSTATAIDNPNVLSKLESEDFVAIKLGSATEEYKQFTQIYRIVPVPSIFFIGSNGRPIEIIAGASTPDAILARIETVLSASKTNAQPVASSAATCLPSPQVPTPTPATSVATKTDALAVGTSSPSPSVSAVEKAKELVEKTRLAKLEEEKAKEKEREDERRRVGKEVQQLRRWQQDQEMKQLMEEREKEKREEKTARERVRQQIAMDKAERAKRNQKEAEVVKKEEEAPVTAPTLPTTASSRSTARLQIRMLDGSTWVTQLAATDRLSVLRRQVIERMSGRPFTMAIAFPRRELTAELDSQSMAELGLTPTAVVLVLPAAVATTVVGQSGVVMSQLSRLLWAVVMPVFTIFNYMRGFVFGGGSTPGPSANQDAAARRRAEPPTEPQARPARNPPPTTTIRRQGNVHRLAQAQDSSDEENNTWNGNSTQQM